MPSDVLIVFFKVAFGVCLGTFVVGLIGGWCTSNKKLRSMFHRMQNAGLLVGIICLVVISGEVSHPIR